MTSKLDPFFSQLFDQLAGEGLSYRTVCKSLLVQGVEISPQALRSWFVRRTQKIANRSSALPMGHFNSHAAISVQPIQAGLFSKREEGAALATSSSSPLVSTTAGPLALRIQAEEQKLCAPSHEQNFLLPKKKLGHS